MINGVNLYNSVLQTNNMKDIFDQLNKQINSLLPEIEKETNNLIEEMERTKPEYLSKINSTQKEDKEFIKKITNNIEYKLDFLTTPFTKKQFSKAVKYWEKLNPESAKYYKELYKDLYE